MSEIYDRRMATDVHSIQPLTVDTWDAFAGLVERHNGISAGAGARTSTTAPNVSRGTRAAARSRSSWSSPDSLMRRW